jgi:peroxiredoxin
VNRLIEGQTFPSLILPTVDGGTVKLPDDLAGTAAVILVYRGSWCPYCEAQLASYARAYERLTRDAVRVVAVSADSRSDAESTVAEHKLPFPVAYGVDPHVLADLIGNYVGNDMPRPYAQSTNVLLDDQGRVLIAVYSSGAIGRLAPADVIGYLAHLRGEDER